LGQFFARLKRELTLFVRQLAWLHATPKPPAGSKQADPKFQRDRLSRLAQMKKDKIPVLMPPNPAPFIIGRLMEMGLTEAAGMGAAPLSWLTIEAWQRVTSIPLPSWEARLIRQLSLEYLSESQRAEDMSCPPPWRTDVTQAEKQAEDDGLAALAALAKHQKR